MAHVVSVKLKKFGYEGSTATCTASNQESFISQPIFYSPLFYREVKEIFKFGLIGNCFTVEGRKKGKKGEK